MQHSFDSLHETLGSYIFFYIMNILVKILVYCPRLVNWSSAWLFPLFPENEKLKDMHLRRSSVVSVIVWDKEYLLWMRQNYCSLSFLQLISLPLINTKEIKEENTPW